MTQITHTVSRRLTALELDRVLGQISPYLLLERRTRAAAAADVIKARQARLAVIDRIAEEHAAAVYGRTLSFKAFCEARNGGALMHKLSYHCSAQERREAISRTDHWRKLASELHDARTWDERLGDALNSLPFVVWLAAAGLAVALSIVW